MSPIPRMQKVAVGLTTLYGLAAISTGIVGLMRVEGGLALVVGLVGGLLLLLSAAVIFSRPLWGLLGALNVAFLLLVYFAPRLLEPTRPVDEHTLERLSLLNFLATPAGAVALLMTFGGLVVVVVAQLALLMSPPRPAEDDEEPILLEMDED